MTIDTHEMLVVHRIFRREFGLMPRLVTDVRDGDRARAARVAEHVHDVMNGLHHHHTGEDELLWPKLLQRVELEAELVRRMEAQHEVVAEQIERAHELTRRWVQRADAVTRDELATVLTRLNVALMEHLHDEEELVLPLVAEHITQAEWDALGERGRAGIPKGRKGLLFLGATLEDATEDERRAMLGSMPLAARVTWRLVGRRYYDRQTASLRRGVEAPALV